MPRSRGRKQKPSSARRRHVTPAAQEPRRRKSFAKRHVVLLRAAGWSLVGLAVVLGVSHYATHLGAWAFASQGAMDLVAGYPMAAALGVGGAIILTRE